MPPHRTSRPSRAPSARRLALGALLLAAAAPPLAAQERYDVVLAGGRVMDPETGLDAVRNVGIRGEVVAAISTEPLEGDVVIDAGGLVVAPGFIDLHAHGQSHRANEYQARDGVTSALELESGVPDVAAFLRARRGDALLNHGATISHMAARTEVMPQHAEAVARARPLLSRQDTDDPDVLRAIDDAYAAGRYDPVPAERMDALLARLRQGLAEGALGVGMAHQYYPGATHEEILRVFQMASGEAAPIFTHVRDMSLAAMQEVVANAAATGASLHIVHVNSSSLGNIDPVL
ncbi:MAG: amidohydrolase family protein, partial [Rhodothermales bacterium]|nr:amidohydrolase family protein [Rhodothermales bacterium]